MMDLVLPLLLCLAWLANAAVIPSPSNATTELEARNSANGYRSVAYFVNWVSHITWLSRLVTDHDI